MPAVHLVEFNSHKTIIAVLAGTMGAEELEIDTMRMLVLFFPPRGHYSHTFVCLVAGIIYLEPCCLPLTKSSPVVCRSDGLTDVADNLQNGNPSVWRRPPPIFLCKGHNALTASCSPHYLQMQHHINLGNSTIIYICIFKTQAHKSL